MDKKFDPNEGITRVPYPKAVVEWIDKMLEFKKIHNCQNIVEGDSEWDLIDYLYKGWQIVYPDESSNFEQSMDFIRRHTVNKGIAKDKGEAMIQHQLEVPENFYKMFRVLFPYQNWDKKFVTKFINHFPQFDVNK